MAAVDVIKHRVKSIPRDEPNMSNQTLLLLSLLLISLAATSAWGEEQGAAEATSHDSVPRNSNIEGWDEEEEGAEGWTFFGMGYENRTSAATGSAAATAAGVGGGKGKGSGKK